VRLVAGNTDDDDWQPATSRPGEIYTVEGRIRQVGHLARSWKRKEPRLRGYRREMRRVGLAIVGLGLVVVVIVLVVSAAL
jgi:hypothetical protein